MFDSKNFRKENNLYQEQLAQILGVTQSMISRIENNGLDITKDQVLILSEKFGKEAVEKYIVQDKPNFGEQFSKNNFVINAELVSTIKSQNEIIGNLTNYIGALNRKLHEIEEKLDSLIERL